MKTKQHIRFGSLCCALFLAGNAFADAQISSHELGTTLQSDKPGSPTSEELFVPGFDPALGTLTGVSLRVDVSIDGTWAVENLDNKERIEAVGGGARVSLFVGPNGSKRKLTGTTAGNQAIPTFAPFDGVADCRGSSANQSPFAKEKTALIKLEPNDFWMKTANPEGAQLSLSMLSQFVHPVDMIGCIQAGAKVSIRVDYHYDDGGKGELSRGGLLTSCTPEPIHAWREDRESPFA